MKNISKSSLIAAALSAFLAPNSEKGEAAILRRLDKLTRQFDVLDRDQTILIEAVALFVRHQLSIAAPIAEAHQPIVRAQGRARFTAFIEQLAQQLQRGSSLVRQVSEEIAAPPPMPEPRDPDRSQGEES